jgi:hypothetical protein
MSIQSLEILGNLAWEKKMKTSIGLFLLSFSFMGLIMGSGLAVAADTQPDKQEEVQVTAPVTADTITQAKRTIAFIRLDSGYYYSGAAGALHRIHDVKEQQAIIDQADRMPASKKN